MPENIKNLPTDKQKLEQDGDKEQDLMKNVEIILQNVFIILMFTIEALETL